MSGPPISELNVHLGYWLRCVSNDVSQAFARKVAAKGVTVAEWVLLRTLFGREDISPTVIANDMGMTKGAISKLADRLVAKGYLVRTANPADGRAQTLRLAKEARRLVPELAALADQNDADFFDQLTSEDRATLMRILKDLVARRGLTRIPID